jgi:hypothetical protein
MNKQRPPSDLTVERDEDGSFVVGDNQTVVYGHGHTLADAQRDYAASLIEYADTKPFLILVCEACGKRLVIPGWLSWGEDVERRGFCKPECKAEWYAKMKRKHGDRR